MTPDEINYYADKLIIYSILSRQTQIMTKDGAKTLETINDLKHLKKQASASEWYDPELGSLAGRRTWGSKFYPSYTQLIDEVGQDQKIIRLWGQLVSYEQHIAGRKIRRAIDRRTKHGLKTRRQGY